MDPIKQIREVAAALALLDDGRPITHPAVWDCRVWAKRLNEAADELDHRSAQPNPEG